MSQPNIILGSPTNKAYVALVNTTSHSHWKRRAQIANMPYAQKQQNEQIHTISWDFFSPAKKVSEILASRQVQDNKFISMSALEKQTGLGHIYQNSCTALAINASSIFTSINSSQDVPPCSQAQWRGSSSAKFFSEPGWLEFKFECQIL